MNIVFKNFIHVSKNESENILRLRNEKYVRKQMIADEIIESKAHFAWIDSLTSNEYDIYFAIFNDDLFIGSIYITSLLKTKKTATWGFYFDENTNPICISFCVYTFMQKIFFEFKIEKIISKIKKTNINAYEFNKSFGFLLMHEDEDYFSLELKKDDWENSNVHKLKKRFEKFNYKFA